MSCIANTKEGKKCSANPMKGTQFCFMHNPKVTDKMKKEIQARGGKKSAAPSPSLPSLEIQTAQDVIFLLEDTINNLRAGVMDSKVANSIGLLSGYLLKAIEISSIQTKVETIERAVLERKTTYTS